MQMVKMYGSDIQEQEEGKFNFYAKKWLDKKEKLP
jgi:hypothetical protein